MPVELLQERFGTEPRHRVRQRVFDSMIVGQVVEGSDMEQIRVELGLLDLTDRQVNEAFCALRWKHQLVSIRRPQVGRITRGWRIRKLAD